MSLKQAGLLRSKYHRLGTIMLDKWTIKLVSKPLLQGAKSLDRMGIRADQVSIGGFCIGMLCLPLLYFHLYYWAMLCIVLNRTGDGLDGSLARLNQPTDAGGYLDICLDFIFYSSVVLGFALADPQKNSLAAAVLIFSFIGTGSSFLAFGIMAERRKIKNIVFLNKGFYYLNGLAEGTETIIVLVLFCLLPQYFEIIALFFAAVCILTTAIRVYSGYTTLS